MATRVRESRQSLSLKAREALLAGSTPLINSLFDDYPQINSWKRETIFLTSLGKHLPRTYFSHYTPLFFKQFGACVISMAWKFAQPKPLPPSSVAEQLAGWAIVQEAQEILKQENPDGNANEVLSELHLFTTRCFPDRGFLLLFDPSHDGREEAPPATLTTQPTSLAFEDWFSPFPGRTHCVHPYAGGGELVGQAYQQWLTRRERKTLAAAVAVLIDEIFDGIALANKDESEQFALFSLNWHLPSHYQAAYTPRFQKQFIVCIFTAAWKLVQPKPMLLSSIAEELAAWAIITIAKQQVELDNEMGDEAWDWEDDNWEELTPEDAFENFLEVFLEDEDFLLLFDAKNEGIETSPVGQWLHITSLAFQDWCKPFTDELERLVHPSIWRA